MRTELIFLSFGEELKIQKIINRVLRVLDDVLEGYSKTSIIFDYLYPEKMRIWFRDGPEVSRECGSYTYLDGISPQEWTFLLALGVENLLIRDSRICVERENSGEQYRIRVCRVDRPCPS